LFWAVYKTWGFSLVVLSLIAYLLAHWSTQWSHPHVLDWKAASDLTLSVLWLKLLNYIQTNADITARYGFEIVLKPIPIEVFS
jgi:hypothetical protein